MLWLKYNYKFVKVLFEMEKKKRALKNQQNDLEKNTAD
jgi:hypothetical protein